MGKEIERLADQLCAGMSRDDFLLWTGYLIEHQAHRINLLSLARLRQAREMVLAGEIHLEPHNSDTETKH